MTSGEIVRLRGIGALLAAIRADDETAVVVSFSTRAYDVDTGDCSVGVTIRKDGEEATAHAAGTDLATALMIARGNVDHQINARQRRLEKKRQEQLSGSRGES